jgi:phage tail-like protein
MATGDRKDPYRGYNFRLEIDGIQRAGFRECSGLDANQDPVEYREGNEKVFTPRKLPALVKYSNIVLKAGFTDDHSLWDWRKDIIDGKVPTERKNGSVVLMDEHGDEKLRWDFVNGWPSKWSGPSMNATSNDVAIETVEIAHEGCKKH